MQKKLLAILLSVLMLLGAFPIAIFAEDDVHIEEAVEETAELLAVEESAEEEEDGLELLAAETIEISDADGLLALMNSTDPATDWAKNYTLTADITLPADSTQAPIGTTDVAFTGVFDGGNFTITGINLSSDTNAAMGLFGTTISATIKNVKLGTGSVTGNATVDIAGNTFSGSTGSASGTGALIGCAMGNTKVTNAHNNGVMVTGGNKTGGLIGCVWFPTTGGVVSGSGAMSVPNATSKFALSGSTTALAVTVTGKAGIGGLIGSFVAGGNSAYTGSFTIENCTNNATVEGTQTVGGIFGYLYHRAMSTYLTNLTNKGTVSITGTGTLAGGIFGYVENNAAGAKAKVIMTNLRNEANLQFDSAAGNIGGIGGEVIASSSNASTISAEKLYNSGSVTAKNATKVGGILGWFSGGSNAIATKVTFKDIYSSGNIHAKSHTGGVVGRSDSYVSLSITNADVACNITCEDVNGQGYVGGIYGYGYRSGVVTLTNALYSGKITLKNALASEKTRYLGAAFGVPISWVVNNLFWTEQNYTA